MQAAMTIMEPFWLPVMSASTPMRGGMTAPPHIPIIISPEISFVLSGRAFIACEYITENMLEQKNPMAPASIMTDMVPEAKNMAATAMRASIILTLKYITSFIFIYAGAEGCLLHIKSCAFYQKLGRYCIDPYIDSDNEKYAEKQEKYGLVLE